MARRWYFSVKTLQGKTLSVEMTDSAASGNDVNLSIEDSSAPGFPTDNPVVIDETHSDDLTDVLRAKTGYINLVENVSGGLDSLYAKTNDQISVEITYDGVLMFCGFVQAQAFENDYMKEHRTVKLPIMSYIEYLREQPISSNNYEEMGATPLYEIFGDLLTIYSRVVMPYIRTYDQIDDNDIHPLRLALINRALCPYNDEYNFGIEDDGVEPEVYNPITYGELLEGICNLFGFIAHDVGDALVFTKFDHDGDYMEFDPAEVADPESDTTIIGTGDESFTLANLFEIFSDKNHRNTADSRQKIRVEFEDVPDEITIPFNKGKYVTINNSDNINDGGPMVVLEYKGCDIISNRWTTDAVMPYESICLCGDSKNEFLMLYMTDETAPMFTCIFDSIHANPKSYNRVRITVEHPDNAYRSYRIRVKSGDMYYDYYGEEGDVWKPASTYDIYHDFMPDDDGNIFVPIAFYGDTVQVIVYRTSGAYTLKAKVKEITMLRDEDAMTLTNRYLQAENNHYTIQGDIASQETAEINQRFYFYEYNFTGRQQYLYLRKAQPELKLIMRPKTTLDLVSMYIKKAQIFSETGVWRIISTNMSLIDDEFTIYAMSGEY